MLIKNVYYSQQPPQFEIRRSDRKAVVLFPTDVTRVPANEEDEEPGYLAENVYYLVTGWTENLESRILSDPSKWLKVAKIPTPVQTTIPDLEEAINTLTEIVLGGE